jgi:hypothetical protein
MNGTIPNHAKKHMKNDIDVIQNVLMGMLLKFKRLSLVAFPETAVFIIKYILYVQNYVFILNLNVKL